MPTIGMEDNLMKITIVTICIVIACALVVVSFAPSVESATMQSINDAHLLTQLRTIDHNVLKEKLQNYDMNRNPLPTIKKLIEILNTDFHIVLPGVIIILLFYMGTFLQGIAIGPFLYFIGAYLEFFAVMLMEIIHALGMEIYWPYPEIPIGKNQ
jgi:hypothetical protein